jgi:phosphoribosylformylglycinamidine synthase
VTSLQALALEPGELDRVAILVLAGGFSYGDALGAGRLMALEIDLVMGSALGRFVSSGRPVMGICNGFQVLTRLGLLPGALGHNRHGRFECRWVSLHSPPSHCVWTSGLTEPITCPIAHGEGRYVHPDPDLLAAAGQVALRYADGNPNGSVADIAGVCDPTGVVLGLMPHPEDHVVERQHPRALRHERGGLGLELFVNGVGHAKGL